MLAPSIAAAQDAGSDDDVVSICEGTCETMTVWRLVADWGYPRGPHDKTRLESKASLNAAKYRWALTEQDALDMNLHLCSWAPAESVEVNKCAFMEIWDHNGAGSYVWRNKWKNIDVRIFDERCLPHIDNSDELWDLAFNHECATEATTTTTTSTTTTAQTTASTTGSTSRTAQTFSFFDDATTGTTGGGVSRSTSRATFGRSQSTVTGGGGSAASRDGIPSALAYTGAETLPLAGVGTALLASGAALTSFAARKRRVAEAAAAAETSKTRD